MIARAMIGSCGKLASTDAPDVVLRVLLLTPPSTPTSTNCTTEAYHDAAARTRTRTRSLHRGGTEQAAFNIFLTAVPDHGEHGHHRSSLSRQIDEHTARTAIPPQVRGTLRTPSAEETKHKPDGTAPIAVSVQTECPQPAGGLFVLKRQIPVRSGTCPWTISACLYMRPAAPSQGRRTRDDERRAAPHINDENNKKMLKMVIMMARRDDSFVTVRLNDKINEDRQNMVIMMPPRCEPFRSATRAKPRLRDTWTWLPAEMLHMMTEEIWRQQDGHDCLTPPLVKNGRPS
ncbi:hypothetical protein DCS_02212 [Drechmeria coniospora]|uniref:Uncharacterized protein n=1 Tax=Drechmeria coniospora TaxID=98403 RepID=A0A151GVH6_DRECN|nr:hypothetical protein DCS_02212 [Drechmeria coniospora]KYK61071.1 hypothetical protein DCS_02212 [Drechmeria coniospora]